MRTYVVILELRSDKGTAASISEAVRKMAVGEPIVSSGAHTFVAMLLRSEGTATEIGIAIDQYIRSDDRWSVLEVGQDYRLPWSNRAESMLKAASGHGPLTPKRNRTP